MVTKVFEEEKSLRDLILRLSEGMTVYGEVNRIYAQRCLTPLCT